METGRAASAGRRSAKTRSPTTPPIAPESSASTTVSTSQGPPPRRARSRTGRPQLSVRGAVGAVDGSAEVGAEDDRIAGFGSAAAPSGPALRYGGWVVSASVCGGASTGPGPSPGAALGPAWPVGVGCADGGAKGLVGSLTGSTLLQGSANRERPAPRTRRRTAPPVRRWPAPRRPATTRRPRSRGRCHPTATPRATGPSTAHSRRVRPPAQLTLPACLLYTSDAADDLLCVDLGGRRIIK